MTFLTVEEFAKKIRVCPHTIRKCIKEGKINAFRPGIGKRSPFRIPETEIDRLQIMFGNQRLEGKLND